MSLDKYRLFNLDLNVKSEIVYFILDGRVFQSPAVLLKEEVVLFVFEAYIIVVQVIVFKFYKEDQRCTDSHKFW